MTMRFADRAAVGLSPRTCRIIRLTALAWSVAMVGLLALSSRIELLDAQPGGKAFELEAKPYLMASFAIGAVLAWWWELGGAIVASFSAAGLSAFALGQLERPSALLVLTGFI